MRPCGLIFRPHTADTVGKRMTISVQCLYVAGRHLMKHVGEVVGLRRVSEYGMVLFLVQEEERRRRSLLLQKTLALRRHNVR